MRNYSCFFLVSDLWYFKVLSFRILRIFWYLSIFQFYSLFLFNTENIEKPGLFTKCWIDLIVGTYSIRKYFIREFFYLTWVIKFPLNWMSNDISDFIIWRFIYQCYSHFTLIGLTSHLTYTGEERFRVMKLTLFQCLTDSSGAGLKIFWGYFWNN